MCKKANNFLESVETAKQQIYAAIGQQMISDKPLCLPDNDRRRFSFEGHISDIEAANLAARLSESGLSVVVKDLGRSKWRVQGIREHK